MARQESGAFFVRTTFPVSTDRGRRYRGCTRLKIEEADACTFLNLPHDILEQVIDNFKKNIPGTRGSVGCCEHHYGAYRLIIAIT